MNEAYEKIREEFSGELNAIFKFHNFNEKHEIKQDMSEVKSKLLNPPTDFFYNEPAIYRLYTKMVGEQIKDYESPLSFHYEWARQACNLFINCIDLRAVSLFSEAIEKIPYFANLFCSNEFSKDVSEVHEICEKQQKSLLNLLEKYKPRLKALPN